MIKTIGTIFFTVCIIFNGVVGAEVFKLPSLPEATLQQVFPKYERISLDSMIRLKQDLEQFRKIYLEGYNRALIRHASNIDVASKRLELLRANSKIGKDEYETSHDILREELRKLGPRGEYLQLYRDFLSLYQDRMKWADGQLEIEKRKVRRTRIGF